MPPPCRTWRSRIRRVCLVAAEGILLSAVLLATLCIGAIVHLNLPAGRAAAAEVASALASSALQGEIRVGSVVRILPGGVRMRDVLAFDASGEEVVRVSELRVRMNPLRLLREFLFSDRILNVVLDHVRVQDAVVAVVENPVSHLPRIAEAFTPASTPSATRSEPRRALRVFLPSIEIGSANVKLRLSGVPQIDGCVTRIHASLAADASGIGIEVARFAVQARESSGLVAAGTGSFQMSTPDRLWTSFEGYLGKVQVNARLGLKGRRVALSVEVPYARPEEVQTLWPDWPLVVPASASLSLVGDPPLLRTKVALDLESAGAIGASGLVDLDRLKADLAVYTHALNLRAFHGDAPEMQLTSAGGVTLQRPERDWLVDVTLRTSPTLLQGEPVPSLETVARYDSRTLSGTAVLHEPGAPLRLAYRLAPGKPVHLDIEVPWFMLEQTPRVQNYAAGTSGSVRGDVSLDIGRSSFTSTARVELRRLRQGLVELASGRIEAELSGDPSTPQGWTLTTTSRVSGASYGTTTFASGNLSTWGALLGPHFTLSLADPRRAQVQVSGHLDLDEKFEIGGLRVALERGGHALAGQLERLRVDGDLVELAGLSLDQGSGSVRGHATISDKVLDFDVQARALNLGETSEILGLTPGMVAGTVDCDAVLTQHGKALRRGTVRGQVQTARIGSSPTVTASFDAALEGETLTGGINSEVEGVGVVSGHWDARLAGSITDGATWSALTGDALFELNYLRLSALEEVLKRYVPVSHVDGLGYAQVRFMRKQPTALPQVMFIGVTQGLALDIETPLADRGDASGDPDLIPETGVIEVRGVDLQVGVTLDQTSGNATGSVQMVHGREPWINASGSMALALTPDDLLYGTVYERLHEARFQVRASILDRPIADLPEWLPLTLPAERLSAELALSGSIDAPIATGRVELTGLAMPGSSLVTPADVDLRATYDFIHSSLVAYGEATIKGQSVAVLQLQSAPLDPGVPARAQTRRTYGLLNLEGLPLTVIASLADADVGGQLFGTVSLEQGSESPQVTANLRAESLAIDLLPLGKARLIAHTDGPILNARARLSKDGGSLEARVISPVDWSTAIPQIPEDGSIAIGVDAENYDAAILEPFVSELFGELSGSIDADLAVDLETHPSSSEGSTPPGNPNPASTVRPERQWKGSVRGTASLRNGVVQERSMGLELRNVQFDVNAKSQRGLTAIEIRNFAATARSEVPNLRAEGILYLDGLELVRATAAMSFKDFPIVVGGVSRAAATGGANAQLEKQADRMSVNVSIPDLNAVLPRNQGRSVLALDEERSIRLLQPLVEPSKRRGRDALPWHIQVEFGDRVRVSRDEFNVPFRGTPEVWLSEDVKVGGEINLVPGGRVELLGKVFLVDSGVIRFDTGDPSNPSINITAAWSGPSHLVTVRLEGTVEDATMTLTSDPPLPEAEVFALILGGRPEEGGSATATGFSVGSQLWNDLFANTALSAVNISASSEEERAKYSAAVRVSEEVWFEASYKSGADAAQASPGASGSEPGVSGTVDWRFSRDWSLRTDVGTLGAGFDLLWQYRY